MKHLYRLLVMFVVGIHAAYAAEGVPQKHLSSISPDSTEVTPKSSFVFTFDMPILPSSVNNRTAVLIQKNIAGKNIFAKVYRMAVRTFL